MNESFADFEHIAQFKTNKDYLPNYHKLQEESISGYVFPFRHMAVIPATLSMNFSLATLLAFCRREVRYSPNISTTNKTVL